MIINKLIATIILCVFAANATAGFNCKQHAGETVSATLSSVSDGDTSSFHTQYGYVDIRYWGVDTPESEWPERWPAQSHSSKAKQFNQSELSQGRITLKFTGDKTYRRCVAEVFIRGKSLSLSLIENGHGWWNSKYAPDYTELELAQESAKFKKLGLWSHPNPEAPWDFRMRHPKLK